MSPDATFAAQFWLWPDPAMKRDAYGRILFVNAAFLHLYGGSVEAWTGNVLQGWPAPQPATPGAAPAPYRFETRVPSTDPSQGEQVYDWIEQSEQDGSAFALARNITAYMKIAPQVSAPQTSFEQPIESQQSQPAAQDYGVQDYAAQTQQTQVPQTHTVQAESDPISPSIADLVETQPAQLQDQQAQQPLAETPSINTSPVIEPHMSAAQENPLEQAASQASLTPTEERDFERRALPMDSNNSILGNNWRDAVIAKAVGAETTETPAASTEDATATADEGGSVETRRILLAEDNAINALLTRTLLEAEGHTVETVEDGLLAVEAMKSNSYDLIFMDMRMPNMDGLEATRKIRQLPNVPKDLPIVALTANAFDDDRNACFDSGMNDFMTKPVSAEELSQMVTSWTGQDAEKQAA